jgi:hypothetical protein
MKIGLIAAFLTAMLSGAAIAQTNEALSSAGPLKLRTLHPDDVPSAQTAFSGVITLTAGAHWSSPVAGCTIDSTSKILTCATAAPSSVGQYAVLTLDLGTAMSGGWIVSTGSPPPPPPPPPPPVITSLLTASGLVGTAFSYQIAADGAPTGFDAAGLPSWLSVNKATGVISGMPSAVGVYSIAISATNAAGTTGATLALSVSAVLPPTVLANGRYTVWSSSAKLAPDAGWNPNIGVWTNATGSGNSCEKWAWNGTTLATSNAGSCAGIVGYMKDSAGKPVIAATGDSFSFTAFGSGWIIKDTTTGHYLELTGTQTGLGNLSFGPAQTVWTATAN